MPCFQLDLFFSFQVIKTLDPKHSSGAQPEVIVSFPVLIVLHAESMVIILH